DPRQRGGAPRSLLGAARRRRELRRGHLLRVPAPPGRPRGGRADALAPGPGPRADALVPRLYPGGAGGADRLLHPSDRAAVAALPAGVLGAEGVRGGLVLARAGHPRRRDLRADPRPRPDALRGAGDAAAGAAVRLRSALPAGAPVVLARRLYP